MKSWSRIIKDLSELLLEIIFPSTLVEKKVRSMDLEDFDRLKSVNFDEERRVLSFFRYRNPYVREAIRQIKYKRNRKLARTIALIIYSELLEEIADLELFENFTSPVLVPIPMSRKERVDRGYNQVELLIEEIVSVSNGNLSTDFNLLQKTRNTERQTKLKKEERLKNVKGVFETVLDVYGKNIILVDDVSTTGTTINEARKVLERSGAKVFVIVVAT